MKSDEVYGQKYSDINFVVQVVLPARFPYFQVFEQLRHMHQKFKMLCAIWYHLYNLKHVNNTSLWVFFTFFKLYQWYKIAKSITSLKNIYTKRSHISCYSHLISVYVSKNISSGICYAVDNGKGKFAAGSNWVQPLKECGFRFHLDYYDFSKILNFLLMPTKIKN